MTTREVTPNGWTSWVVTVAAGDTIRVRATCPSGYGWIAVMTTGYDDLTSRVRFDGAWPGEVSYVAPAAGKFRVGLGRKGPTTVSIDVEPAILVRNRWPIEGPMTERSFWRTRIEDAPLSPRSDEFMADIRRQVAASAGGVLYFNGWQYNIPRYVVNAAVKRLDVKFRDEQKKGYTPRQLFQAKYGAHFVGVPLTPEMVPAVGTDAALSVWCPDTDQLWCFWRLRLEADGTWSAVWGGRIDNVSTSLGYYLDGMGTSATGTATEVGCLGIDEVRAGSIDHALSLTLLQAAKWSTFVWPAQRSDGSGGSPVPEGTRLRLDPTVDVASLKLTPIGKMVALAAQRYGFIVTDKSAGSVTLSAEANRDPGTGDVWAQLLGKSRGWDVFKGFPWDRMQVIEPTFGRP